MTLRRSMRGATFVLIAGAIILALIPHRPEPAWWPDSASHAGAFFVISLCVRLGWPNAKVGWLLGLIAILGGAIEIAQWAMAMGRDGEVSDWVADVGSAAVALAMMGWAGRRAPA